MGDSPRTLGSGSYDYTSFINRLNRLKGNLERSPLLTKKSPENEKTKSAAGSALASKGETSEEAAPFQAKDLKAVKTSIKELAATTQSIYKKLKHKEKKEIYIHKKHEREYKDGWQTLQVQKKELDDVIRELESSFSVRDLNKQEKKILKGIKKERDRINKILNKGQKAFEYETGIRKMSLWTKAKQLIGFKASEEAMHWRREAFEELAITEQKVTFLDGTESLIPSDLQKTFGLLLKNDEDFKNRVISYVKNNNTNQMEQLYEEIRGVKPGQLAVLRMGPVDLNLRINGMPILNQNSSPAIVAATVGDGFGFGNGAIESNNIPREDLNSLIDDKGVLNLEKFKDKVRDQHHELLVSDDTIFARAVQAAIIQGQKNCETDLTKKLEDEIISCLGKEYTHIKHDYTQEGRPEGYQVRDRLVINRAHGDSLKFLDANGQDFKEISSKGCGSAMRTGVYGVAFHGPENRQLLTNLIVRDSIMTHPHPNAIIGALASGLMAAYAAEDLPFAKWPQKFREEVKIEGKAYNKALELVIANKERIDEKPLLNEEKDKIREHFTKEWQACLDVLDQHIELRGFNKNSMRFTDSYSLTPEGLFEFWKDMSDVNQPVLDSSGKQAVDPNNRRVFERVPMPTLENEAIVTPEARKKVTIDPGAWMPDATRTWPGRTGLDTAVISLDLIMAKAWEAAGKTPDAFKSFKPSDLKQKVDQEPVRGKFFTEIVQAGCWHEGDSDSTGTIVMLVLGQALGENWIPKEILREAKSNVYR